ncbi:MAG: proline--tRNA ligase, partial [Thermodesulfovibrionales bacterium]
LSMPVLHPAEVWQQTGRWFDIGGEMFRLKDRTNRDMCLAMTHEEIMTWLASKEIRSYRDLPQIWYQIQTKMRDEARPKSGILRTREFIMKDSYSFDADEDGLQRSYELHIEAYNRIFQRCGLRFYMVESDPGMMGGNVSHEFMAPSMAGEDEIVRCENCGYTANVEVAKSIPFVYETLNATHEEVYTPDLKTVVEVSGFLGIEPHHFIKSLLYISKETPILALVRGDQELNEKKLSRILGNTVRPAHKEEVSAILGVEAGYIGPMGHSIRIIADEVLREGVYVTGANKSHYHVKGIVPQKDFTAEWYDIHTAKNGDKCPKCEHFLAAERVIEIGNIFKLGTRYSEPLRANFLNQEGNEKPIIMGSYGIGPARIAASAIEQNNDKDGIIWPQSIAPFTLEIIPLNMKDQKTRDIAENIYNGLIQRGIDVLLDDREERPGVKFKDADLIGIPYQLIIGEKSLKAGYIEIKDRRTRQITKIEIENPVDSITGILK